MPTCLIVEDEPLIAFDLKCRLEEAGYSISGVADSMQTAEEALIAHKPDLVFMDICINGAHDGVETASLIRRRHDLPVVFVTGRCDVETLERAKHSEPFGYIVKPFNTVDFRAQVEIALWKHGMEKQLRMSEAWLASTLYNIADAVIATDLDGIVVFLNPAAEELTGWSSGEAAGRLLRDVFVTYEKESGQPVLNPLKYLCDKQAMQPGPTVLFLRSRDPFRCTPIETRVSANQDAQGSIGSVVSFSDVTERQKAQEERRQLEKSRALALLATGAGLELSALLRDAEACIQELLHRVPNRLREFARNAYFSTENALAVTLQLAELGKEEKGQPTTVDLNALVSEITKKTSRRSEASKWTTALDLEPSLPAIEVDPESCKANVIRLLREAKRAMPAGGEIRVSTRLVATRTGEYDVQLIVRDTGMRLPYSAPDRTFDPYYHARSNNRNAGLSLALVYHFVSTNGGSIECSKSDQETELVMSFPAVVTPERPMTASARDAS